MEITNTSTYSFNFNGISVLFYLAAMLFLSLVENKYLRWLSYISATGLWFYVHRV